MTGYVGLSEVVLESADPERLVDFYEVAIGFVGEESDGVWRVLLGCTWLVIRRGERRAPVALTWVVEDLEAELARLRARGLDVQRTSSADVGPRADYYDWSAGLTDPDGNTVSFVAVAAGWRA